MVVCKKNIKKKTYVFSISDSYAIYNKVFNFQGQFILPKKPGVQVTVAQVADSTVTSPTSH